MIKNDFFIYLLRSCNASDTSNLMLSLDDKNVFNQEDS